MKNAGGIKSIYQYWGKAHQDEMGNHRYHLLPYHCLDVAAVASYWIDHDEVLRKILTGNDPAAKAWLIFFICLHDIGKYDLRFQSKVKAVRDLIYGMKGGTGLSDYDSKTYDHGSMGLAHLLKSYQKMSGKEEISSTNFFGLDFDDETDDCWERWKSWIEAVTAHHGTLIKTEHARQADLPRSVPDFYRIKDQNTRLEWIQALEVLFLNPVGLNLRDIPPEFKEKRHFLAGFCSVCDWLGSAVDPKSYHESVEDLKGYYSNMYKDFAPGILKKSGLTGKSRLYEGVVTLLDSGCFPRQIQTLTDTFKSSSSLIIVEAPTGSGKTEAALAIAWRAIESGVSEGIVFALPTQATANAMFYRLEKAAPRIFEQGPNLILAHGNARYNEEFLRVRESPSGFDSEDGWVQCTEWLAQSRKRAFLGQVGVCTVDQVLTSVLPVRHQFIRGFGLGRSVLIVDEVHAYDTYMYGLLKEVLKAQKAVGGSVLLLSATLPQNQRAELVSAWGGRLELDDNPEKLPYPLITRAVGDKVEQHKLSEAEYPPVREVTFSVEIAPLLKLNTKLINQIAAAGELGANIAVVCNLVADAQQIYAILKQKSAVPVILFHSRYTLLDRQIIENGLINYFGSAAPHGSGTIVVATQVIEQSLDLDFDWMIIQICPCDLLFQRVGRLHRHAQKDYERPHLFKEPLCTVIVPTNLTDQEDYGKTSLIYKGLRTLWRTAWLLMDQQGSVAFPLAYRSWIEAVYSEAPWKGEPDTVSSTYEDYLQNEVFSKRTNARQMIQNAETMVLFSDDDVKIQALTRDDISSLSVLPYIELSGKWKLLDKGTLNKVDASVFEQVALNKVNVPGSWKELLEKCGAQKNNDLNGVYTFPMEERGGIWIKTAGNEGITYSKELGMERIQ